MEIRAGAIAVHFVEHGAGRPVLVLHGVGVDHRETEACFEPVFGGLAGFRRMYPDLPGFRNYLVIQSPEMLERYDRYVAPAAGLVDQAALERIGERWELAPAHGPAYAGPTLVVAGRLDSTVGYAAAADLLDHYPHASLAVVDDAGHALPHEQPELLRALVADWIARVERSG